ncbi:hypothetical protein [Paraburkholderia humisilvae]|uniref:Uncharacterized protein n=1 Tax=Paraburkholderia humisilvae TaxID=627669 RepID=A0A6J5EYW7_9BURK|nr:hypothetical protein [Paraburkholderia humisilvae]CAB3771343.1 hypothetical protein LMG29542_06589 [Paraburkholderia humisilvae]
MTAVKRILFLFSILVLSACHGGASGSSGSSGTPTVSTAIAASSLSNVPVNKSTPVIVAFNPANGGSATALTVTTGLSTLPSGWSAASPSFTCATVNAANPCDLKLTYDPSTAGVSGTLTLGFTYLDSQGRQQQGSVGITYSSAAANSVATSVAPTGPVQGIVGSTSTVSVTFASGDGAPDSNVALVTAPDSLPSGWSVQGSVLPCATVTSAGSCQLQLAYAPIAAAASATLTLEFSYTDDAGAARTGSVAIAYGAVTPGAVTATAAPASASSTFIGSTAAVSVVFSATGGAATNLQITSALPTGWTLAGGTLPCAQVGSGNTCEATLNYAPVSATSATTLTLQYAYTDNFGEARTAQLNIPYGAVPHIAYITNFASNSVTQCTLSVMGALENCTQATSPVISAPIGIALNGTQAYIGGLNGTITLCHTGPTDLSGCVSALAGGDESETVAFDGNVAFISNQGTSTVETCTVAADGTLNGCTVATNVTPFLTAPSELAFQGAHLYIPNAVSPDITVCQVTAGVIGPCTNTSVISPSTKVVLSGTSAYLPMPALNSVQQCSVGADGSLGTCADSGAGAVFNLPFGMTLFGGYAYIVNRGSNTISQCTVAANGQLSACVVSGTALNSPIDIAIQ